ncbi:MAG: conjugative transposon protein TraN [Chryseolinea sp.]
MKSIKYHSLLLFVLTITASLVSAQDANTPPIEITFNKTSSLIFPSSIVSVDRGSRDVLAQRAKGVNNILQLKAGKLNFNETNLTVITADGNLHHFFVRYAETPSRLTLNVGVPSFSEKQSLLFQTDMTEDELARLSDEILSWQDPRKIKSRSKHDMSLTLKGIYIEGNVMFFHLRLENKSNIPYHTEILRFSVLDRRQAKRTASQEIVEETINQTGNASMVSGRSAEDVVFAIPKFTIPDAKWLRIDLKEKRGGRNLSIGVKNRRIIQAERIEP